MGITQIIRNKNGYDHIVLKNNNNGEVIGFSPFTGEELPGGFLWELQGKIFDKLHKKLDHSELEDMLNNKELCTDYFDFNCIPDDMRTLLYKKEWYKTHIHTCQKCHYNGEFCAGFNILIEQNYNLSEKSYLCDIPIQYCPFCGVKLPLEFDQENWWEKEFKTFKWYKDHKLGEWADDYVDDCDWTEDDYPPIDQN